MPLPGPGLLGDPAGLYGGDDAGRGGDDQRVGGPEPPLPPTLITPSRRHC